MKLKKLRNKLGESNMGDQVVEARLISLDVGRFATATVFISNSRAEWRDFLQVQTAPNCMRY